eukprot:TRINITY_DN310_c0_g2_i3.p1 TRINITY_DN310_c0_g2~~TRINITY_DN310_c0_g2_i3.p1  ORF type:complete len:645 (+),score=105.68 TRINITY_DN310_c0_g2_i3:1230-3164(+)
MYFISVIIIVVLYWVVKSIKNYKDTKKKYNNLFRVDKIAMIPILGPIIRSYSVNSSSVPEFSNKLHEVYGHSIVTKLFNVENDIIISRDYQVANDVYRGNFRQRPATEYGLKMIGMDGNGIIWNNVTPKWHELRSFFMMGVRNNNLKDAKRIAENSTHRIFEENVNQEVVLIHMLRKITYEVTCELFLGVDCGGDQIIHAVCEYFKAWKYFLLMPKVYGSVSNILRRQEYKKHVETIEKLNSLTERIIQARRESEDYTDNFLGSLLSEDIPESEIKQCVLEILIAGIDTSSVSLLYTIHYIVENPRYYRELYYELINGKDDLSKSLLNESLRKTPVGPVIMRRADSDTTLLGLDIPKGTNTIINVASMNMRDDLYDNPNEFDITNTSGKNKVFNPFGRGKKSCLGKDLAMVEMTASLKEIVTNYDISCEEQLENVDLAWDIAMQPQQDTTFYIQRKKYMYIIGAHCVGKTTLLNYFVNQQPRQVHHIKEVARNLLSKSKINKKDLQDDDVFFSFQQQLFERQNICEKERMHRSFVSDRCCLDPLVYTREKSEEKYNLFCEKNKAQLEQIKDRYRKQNTHLVIIKPNPNIVKDDGVRLNADIEHMNQVHECYTDTLEELGIEYDIIHAEPLEERYSIICDIWNNY